MCLEYTLCEIIQFHATIRYSKKIYNDSSAYRQLRRLTPPVVARWRVHFGAFRRFLYGGAREVAT